MTYNTIDFDADAIRRNLERANQLMESAICEQTEVMEDICSRINDLLEMLKALDVTINIPGEMTYITEVYYNGELTKIFVETLPCEII